MHDAFLKSVFADRRMVEILIHGHAPEWAAKIDFSTLRTESTGLVSKRTLQQRHPDLIWTTAMPPGLPRQASRTCSSAPIRVATD